MLSASSPSQCLGPRRVASSSSIAPVFPSDERGPLPINKGGARLCRALTGFKRKRKQGSTECRPTPEQFSSLSSPPSFLQPARRAIAPLRLAGGAGRGERAGRNAAGDTKLPRTQGSAEFRFHRTCHHASQSIPQCIEYALCPGVLPNQRPCFCWRLASLDAGAAHLIPRTSPPPHGKLLPIISSA